MFVFDDTLGYNYALSPPVLSSLLHQIRTLKD